ncbi:MAG: single-stranded DNA-binding protein [Clostridia bacterium]|nr:single-stranded DNA-binding protein [Clostridia bacterium]
MNEKQNNKVYLRGTVVTEKRFSHEVYGEGFYEMDVSVKRLSGQEDVLPITVSERLIEKEGLTVGSTLSAIGQFRSCNKPVDGKSKLMLTVFVREIVAEDFSPNPNNIVLTGYICKTPTYRTTPFNREICDLLIAVNRAYNKSDYIPCIAWGRNARFVRNLSVGEKIALAGRIQSREYQKRTEDDVKTLTAYEVSVSKIAASENADSFDVDYGFKYKEDYSPYLQDIV